jgi:hypothetical protein
MRRILIYAGLTAFVLLLLASIPATLAAPKNTPLLQADTHEPNDSFAQATTVNLGVSVRL